MDVNAIRIFVDVARRGGFSAVARDMGVDPSSVSRAVATLELELGVRLLQRSTRSLSLTEAGAVFLERAAPGLEMLEAAREDVLGTASSPAGTLRLATSVAFGQVCIAPLLPEFRSRHPALKLDLVLSDVNADLVADRIDLAIRLAPSVEIDVVGVKLLRSRYRVCASPGYLELAGRPTEPAHLAKRRCLRFSLPGFKDAWRFRGPAGETVDVAVDGDMLASNALVLRTCAVAGLGPALLPDWLVREELAAGSLVDCFPSYEVAATSFETGAWLLYPSRAHLPPKVSAAIGFLRDRLGQAQA